MNSGLSVKNLNFKDILTNINFDLEPGTITALIGKSGSGKTTLLKSIAGLTNYMGVVNIFGIMINSQNIEDERKKIGIYLNTKILDKKTVFLNIIDPLLNLNYQEEMAKKKVYEISKKLGIENLLYKEIETLSHSEKKVVTFAQSVVHGPSIILIDNLFDSLDTFYKGKIISYLNHIKKSKKSIILFTTNNSEDILLAENLLIIKSGKISKIGKTQELLEKENIFLKNDVSLPFISDLSSKMIAYDLIDKPIYDIVEMVDEIWQ